MHRNRPVCSRYAPATAWIAAPPLLAALVLSGCSALVNPAPGGQAGAAKELPVRKVVLYQNGVGYFERRGKVSGNTLELRVRPDQINDVLKSLTVLDLSGGKPSSVSLPVERTGDRLAAELPPQVRRAKGLGSLLEVLRGIEVAVTTRGIGGATGRVVGIEKGSGDRKATLTVMTADQRLVTVPIDDITELEIRDRTLAVGLERSLDISKREGAWKPVGVTVRLAGRREHDVLVSYIHEVPVWRPAYRAWVEEGKGVTLQGWAVVDNVTGEPWEDVRLKLVVGSPLSFRYDLHTPHYVERPDLSGRRPGTAAAPPPSDVGYDRRRKERRRRAARSRARKKSAAFGGALGMRGAGSGGGGMAKSGMAPRAAPAPMAEAFADEMEGDGFVAKEPSMGARMDALGRSAEALVKGKQVGSLYVYESTTPVTVPDRSAALINIVNKKLVGEDVFLFRHRGAAPYRSVLVRNDEDSAFESGPITLYVDGEFAGEGFLGRVEKGATTFIPYAQESGLKTRMRAQTKTSEARLVKVNKGRITVEAKRTRTHTITVSSERDQETIAYVKLRLSSSMKPVDLPKDVIRAGDDIFVRVKVAALGKGEATIVEEEPIRRTERGLSSLVLTALRYYIEDAKVEDKLKGPVREVLAVHERMLEISRRRTTLGDQRRTLEREERRIRRNLDSLPEGKVAKELRKELVTQLELNAKRSSEVAKELVGIEVERARLEEQLVKLLDDIQLK